MKASQPWKQPLRERQVQAVNAVTSKNSWPQLDPSARRTLDDLMSHRTDALGRVPSDYFPYHVTQDEDNEKRAVGLQVCVISCESYAKW